MRRLLLLLILLGLAQPAFADVVRVQGTTETGNLLGDTSEVTSFAAPTTAGNFIAVVIQSNDAGRLVSSVTDSGSNSYSEAVLTTGGAGIAAIWWCDNCAAAQDVTTTIDGNSDGIDRITLIEFSGLDNALTPTSNESSTSSVTSHPTGTASTTVARGLMIGANSCGSGSYTADATFTQEAAGANHMVAYDILDSAITQGMTTTSAANETCSNVLAAWDGIVAASGGGPARFLLLGVGL